MSKQSRILGQAFLEAAGDVLFSEVKTGIQRQDIERFKVIRDACAVLLQRKGLLGLPKDRSYDRLLKGVDTPQDHAALILRTIYNSAVGAEPRELDFSVLEQQARALIPVPTPAERSENVARVMVLKLREKMFESLSIDLEYRRSPNPVIVPVLDSELQFGFGDGNKFTVHRVPPPNLGQCVLRALGLE